MQNPLLNYSSQGEGQPLLIIHGLFGSSRNWKSLAKQFSQNFNVITLDLRNHGASFFDAEMNYSVMVDDVISLMDELSIRSAHILGHSMGGKVAMKLNQQNPSRVNKLVVADISPVSYQHSYDDIVDPVLALNLATIFSRKDADRQLEELIPDQRVRLFLLQNLAFNDGKAYWAINWLALKQNIDSLIGFEAIDHWKIDNQSLFIRGALSTYVSDRNWLLISEHFTNAQLGTIEGAGHWLHAEQPVAFFKQVELFLLT